MDELRRKRIEKSLVAALRTLPTVGTYQDDAVVLIKVLRRWYGDEASNVLHAARSMLLDPGGCSVCGAIILADTEDWPAQLCAEHAPSAVLELLDERYANVRALIDDEPSPLKHVCAAWAMLVGLNDAARAAELRSIVEVVIAEKGQEN